MATQRIDAIRGHGSCPQHDAAVENGNRRGFHQQMALMDVTWTRLQLGLLVPLIGEVDAWTRFDWSS